MSSSTHTNNKYGSILSFVYDSHSSRAYFSHRVWCRRDVVYPSPMFSVYCITSLTLTSQVFIDTLTGSSHRNQPCLAAPDSRSEQLNTILNHMQHIHIHVWNITVHLTGQMGLAVQRPIMSIKCIVITLGGVMLRSGLIQKCPFSSLGLVNIKFILG